MMVRMIPKRTTRVIVINQILMEAHGFNWVQLHLSMTVPFVPRTAMFLLVRTIWSRRLPFPPATRAVRAGANWLCWASAVDCARQTDRRRW